MEPAEEFRRRESLAARSQIPEKQHRNPTAYWA
jgi:hypothetical protein